MKKIVITGNIAAGKSTVEKIISKMGYPLIDTDKICHDLLENEIVIHKIKTLFCDFDITYTNEKLDRNKIGKIVFSDKKYKTKLENIIHPLVKNKIIEFFEKNKHKNLVFVSVPLLFEAGMEKMFDKIIFVNADKKLRLERLIKRNNYTKEYAQIRIEAQDNELEKIKKSDYIINNNGHVNDLETKVRKIVKDLADFN